MWALVVLLVSSLIALLSTRVFLRDHDKAVRRVLFAALLLGNANNLPLLLIRRYVSIPVSLNDAIYDGVILKSDREVLLLIASSYMLPKSMLEL